MSIAEVTIRDLRNHGGDVVDRIVRGERLVVTRDGRPVAELRPVARPSVPTSTLLARWRRLPAVDPGRLRSDLDAVLDATL